MATSGYQIIDFKNIPLSSSAITIKGVYDSIINSKGKCLMATNVTIKGYDTFVANTSYWVTLTKASTQLRLSFTFVSGESYLPRELVIRITPDDNAVLIIGSAPGSEAAGVTLAPTEEVK